jgi:uncharacterized protein YjfI (DUF2170 family)
VKSSKEILTKSVDTDLVLAPAQLDLSDGITTADEIIITNLHIPKSTISSVKKFMYNFLACRIASPFSNIGLNY